MHAANWISLLATVLAAMLLPCSAGAACFDPKTPPSGPWVSGYEMPVQEEIALTKVIAIGRVVGQRMIVSPDDPEGYEATIYTVQIERVLKGRLPPKVRLYSSNTTSRYVMAMDERHILFLTRVRQDVQKDADYFVDNCGNSSMLPSGNATVMQIETNLQTRGLRSNKLLEPTRVGKPPLAAQI